MRSNRPAGWLKLCLCVSGLAAALTSTGCQVSIGGQTLPSPWYHTDDVNYAAPTQEMKLSKEAAALKAYQADQAQRQQQP